MSAFFHAILARSEALLTPTTINSWLKPHSPAGSSRSSVGKPWEIFTPDAGTLTPDHPHTVPIYAKDPKAYQVIYDATLSNIVRAVDKAARAKANVMVYTGSFQGPCLGGTDQTYFNVTVEQDGDSLKLSIVGRNGSDVLTAAREIWGATVGQFLPGPGLSGDFRIFPAKIFEVSKSHHGTEVVREDWRVWWPNEPTESNTGSDIPGVGFSAQKDCLGWTTADWLYYGNEALDHIVFVKDTDPGMVIGLEIPYLRTGILSRV
ncbi:hypothetical protein F5883DRAFT_689104 [Diaporthe sp. PMI_573]|nr:hypothetical protein F5883DRAFT_689104 [Diaporthaceae sp. PMI_573]